MPRLEKLGVVYCARDSQPWARSHAYLPTPCYHGELIRVYLAFRDGDGLGRAGYVDVHPDQPTEPVAISAQPVLDVGEPGSFDTHGVTPCSVLEWAGRRRLYYFGWRRDEAVRYHLLAGLAEDDGGGFVKHPQPLLTPAEEGRFVRSAPFATLVDDAVHLYYVAGSTWIEVAGKQVPTYGIYHQVSADGVTFSPVGTPVLMPEGDDTFGFGRPYLHGKRLWYSTRTVSKGYRLGYAERDISGVWRRCDHLLEVEIEADAWDGEMMCFPALIDTPQGTLLFYNGNGYGATGFGVARLWEDA